MKWPSFRKVWGQSLRDTVLMGFGAWIIWTEVYSSQPNGYLILVGFGFMVPSGRSAIITLLSEPGQSSESSQKPELPDSGSSRREDTGEGETSLYRFGVYMRGSYCAVVAVHC